MLKNDDFQAFILYMIIAVILVTFIVVKKSEPDPVYLCDIYKVSEGDTLDRIALDYNSKYKVTKDYRELVYLINEKNNLGRYIYPGDRLYIPISEIKGSN